MIGVNEALKKIKYTLDLEKVWKNKKYPYPNINGTNPYFDVNLERMIKKMNEIGCGIFLEARSVRYPYDFLRKDALNIMEAFGESREDLVKEVNNLNFFQNNLISDEREEINKLSFGIRGILRRVMSNYNLSEWEKSKKLIEKANLKLEGTKKKAGEIAEKYSIEKNLGENVIIKVNIEPKKQEVYYQNERLYVNPQIWDVEIIMNGHFPSRIYYENTLFTSLKENLKRIVLKIPYSEPVISVKVINDEDLNTVYSFSIVKNEIEERYLKTLLEILLV